jgi:surfactin synthase thioesterase subunit
MTAGTASPWFSAPLTPNIEICLIAIPPAVAGPVFFRDLIPYFPSWLGLRAACLPGRERRISEPPYQVLMEAAEELAHGVAALVNASVPVALFGQCAGALLAYETARLLIDQERVKLVELLIVDQAPPDPDEPALTSHDRPLSELVDWLASQGNTSAEVLADSDLMHLIEPILRADLRMIEEYEYIPVCLPLNVVAVSTSGNPSTVGNWAKLSSAHYRVIALPGNLASDRRAAQLAQLMAVELAQYRPIMGYLTIQPTRFGYYHAKHDVGIGRDG